MTTTSTTATSSTASIVKTLGSGSGLDTAAIVAALVDAQFAARNASLTKRADTLTAQISGLSKLKSGISGFDTALRTLVKGGTLQTQPISSAAGVAAVTGTGAGVAGLAATLTVNRLASAQAATTNTAVSRTAPFRQGTLDVTLGGTTTTLTIGASDATLDGVAAKINAAGLGLTATVITDGGGARLTVKGATGAANAFTITGGDGDSAAAGMSLADLSVGGSATGTTAGTTAADAELVLDGATYHRATNSVADLLTGVRLDLKATGSTVLGTSAPTVSISQAVSDFVETYNQLHAELASDLDPKTGALHNDPAAGALLRQLGAMTTTVLAANPAGAPRTLGDIGVKTNRDGTLTVDPTLLTRMLTSYPAAVEAMFADGAGASNGGLSAALGAIATRAADRTYGFDAETSRATTQQSDVATLQAKATDAAAAMSDRLTKQFAAMDTRVAAYKSTQDFIKQQVDAWNKSS
ncbi:flagellar filament capping protein FliD [Sphingomonas sp.]|uniref:flagellar filament capping protein FliD n=1 Tax=Sphingomonas sp. TaxID=28214 RepID=UPI003CC56827